MNTALPKHPIVLFDGVCNLCNGWVKFLIRNDKKGLFKLGALQSDEAKEVLKDFPEDAGKMDSILLIENGKLYKESTAILRIFKRLGGAYTLAYGFVVVPAFIRDAVYQFIAENRYKWFGREDSCMLPTPETKQRFL